MPCQHPCGTLLAAWLLGAVSQLAPSIATSFSSSESAAVKTTGDSNSCEVDRRQGDSLTIGSCDNAGIKGLLQGMSEWSNLASISLELRYNGLGDAGVEQMATQLSSSPTKSSLTTVHLDLYGNLLGVESVKHLTAALLELPKLLNLTLRLGGNHLGDPGMEHLISATCQMRHLSTMLLDISYNNISRFLAWPSTGRCLSNLKKLDIFLGWNVLSELPDLSRLGACQLTNLTELMVDAQSQSSKSIFKVGRSADPDGVCAEESSSLRSLEIILLGNQLEDDDVLQLLVVMSSMEALESIILWVGSGEQDRISNLDTFAKMLTINLPSLSTLKVNGKQLTLPKRSSTRPASMSTTPHQSASEPSFSVTSTSASSSYTSSNTTTSSITSAENTSAIQSGKEIAPRSGKTGSWTGTAFMMLMLCACCGALVVLTLMLRSRLSRPPQGVLRVSDESESDDACRLVSWTFSENDPDDRPRRAVAPPGSVAAAAAGVAAAAATAAARTPPLNVSMDAAAQLQIHLMGDPSVRHGD